MSTGAGLIQIRDYAREVNHHHLQDAWSEMQTNLKATKAEFFELVCSPLGVNYFGVQNNRKKMPGSVRPDLNEERGDIAS